MKKKLALSFFILWTYSFALTQSLQQNSSLKQPIIGAEKIDEYLPLIKNKNVALVVNHTSKIGITHLVDSLLNHRIKIKKIFAPEHGFRGTVADGETIKDGFDVQSNLPIISLYGNNKKPTESQMSDIDIVIFDIQDVGCRFYTYLSTLFLVMQSCAELEKKLILLDRPNPNGYFVDGPILDKKFESFVGMLPVPIVHGMTLGEMASMIVGENWLNCNKKLDFTIIKCSHYIHEKSPLYNYPIAPSPNLPTKLSILLYPSLCLFEGTEISVGRGTNKPFMIYGNPLLTKMKYTFTPKSIQSSVNPPQKDKLCYGKDLSSLDVKNIISRKKIDLKPIFEAYHSYPKKDSFFLKTNYIDKLYGSDKFRKMILNGADEKMIRATWENDLKTYIFKRKKYLLYP